MMLESDLLPRRAGYIDGHWVAAEDGATFEVRNPYNGELLALVPAMGEQDATRAVDAAAKALERPWTPLDTRRAWLAAIADGISSRRNELGRIITLENGKPHAEAMGEADYAAGFFRHASLHVTELRPRTLEERPREHGWTVHFRPAGVAALITPWNFPLGMIAKKLSAALAAGCPVVVKPAQKTPLSMIALFGILEDVGLPAGMANLVMGRSGPIGKVLCEHPAVRVVSFTGSTAVGRRLLAATAPHIKRVALELGGNAPFLVFEDADLALAADQLVQNKLRASGQTCVCTNRVFVQRRVAEEFTRLLVERLRGLRVGDGMEPGVDLGPLIDREGFEKVQAHLRDALEGGAIRALGADLASMHAPVHPPVPAPAHPTAADPREEAHFGLLFPPTVLRGVRMGMACTREETFGPLFPIIEFESEGEVVRWSNATEYGLAAYVFTQSRERADRVIERLRFGHVGCNTGTGPTPEAPFGGMKQSGFGREGGVEGLFEYVEMQTVPRR